MFSRHNRMMGVLHALADALLALSSFWIAYWIRANLESLRLLYPVYFYLWIVPVVVVLWIGTGWVAGVYRDVHDGELRRAFLDPLKVFFFASLLLFAFTSVFKVEFISRALLGLYAAIDLLLMVAFRLAAYRQNLGGALAGFRNFLLVGEINEVIPLAKEIEANESRGMRLAGFATISNPEGDGSHSAVSAIQSCPGCEDRISGELSGLKRPYPVYRAAELPDLLRRHIIDEVIFAVSKNDLADLEDAFLVCELEGVKARLSLSFFPHSISRVSLDRLRGMPLLTFTSAPEDDYLMFLKRLADFVLAAVLMVIPSPVFLALAILIKLTSRGPVFYRQIRCGLGGRKFTVYKFRSMREGADQAREGLEALNELDGPVFKIKNDPRCTAVGRFMRRLSLDELPQLVNILKGDMSFVGPRPPLPKEVEQYERWQRRRLRMPPGLTCLWALEGRSHLDFKRWMELDLEYIDRWSPSLDWKILLKTIPVVLLGRGAF
ncbi:MAG: sugar transferase [Acidobacteriota bacterium]|nr:sugar transferase [Acidobacteriota bacterium]